MVSPRFRTKYNYDPTDEVEINDGSSQTVPDQSLTVQDILIRFTRGLPLDDQVRNCVYGDDLEQSDDDFEVSPFNSFDHDILDLIPSNSNSVEEPPVNVQNATTTNDDVNSIDSEANSTE